MCRDWSFETWSELSVLKNVKLFSNVQSSVKGMLDLFVNVIGRVVLVNAILLYRAMKCGCSELFSDASWNWTSRLPYIVL